MFRRLHYDRRRTMGGWVVRARNNKTRKYSQRSVSVLFFAVRVPLPLYIPLRLTTTIMIWRRTVPYRRAVSPALIVRTAAAADALLSPIAIVFAASNSG